MAVVFFCLISCGSSKVPFAIFIDCNNLECIFSVVSFEDLWLCVHGYLHLPCLYRYYLVAVVTIKESIFYFAAHAAFLYFVISLCCTCKFSVNLNIIICFTLSYFSGFCHTRPMLDSPSYASVGTCKSVSITRTFLSFIKTKRTLKFLCTKCVAWKLHQICSYLRTLSCPSVVGRPAAPCRNSSKIH